MAKTPKAMFLTDTVEWTELCWVNRFFGWSPRELIVDYLLATWPWVSEQPYPLQIIVSLQKSVSYNRTKERSKKGKIMDWKMTLNGQKGIISKSTTDDPNFRVSKAHLSVTLLQHSDVRLVRKSGEQEGMEMSAGMSEILSQWKESHSRASKSEFSLC